MAVCKHCNSLDYTELFWEEAKNLSWLSEDIAVLYKENRSMLEKIKILNTELEELSIEDSNEPSEDTIKEDDVFIDDSDEMAMWILREDELRGKLVQQLQHLSQDLSFLKKVSCQPLLHQQLRQHCSQQLRDHCQQQFKNPCQDPAVSCQLWGHQTLRWRPPSPSTARKGRTRQQRRLMKWIARRMPNHLIDLS